MATSDPGGSEPPVYPFSAQDAMSFMQKLWNPLGVALPGFGLPDTGASSAAAASTPFPNPAMMFAALDPREIERKLAELRIVENWLSMSLNMMQLGIKTLELQKASLEAIGAAQRPTPPAATPRPKSRKA